MRWWMAAAAEQPAAEQPAAAVPETTESTAADVVAGATEEAVAANEAIAADMSQLFSGISLSQWPQQMDMLAWAQDMHGGTAALLAVFGALYLSFGYYVFKYLVTLNAIVLGIWAGVLVGKTVNQPMPSAIVGGLVAAALTWPLLKYAVAVLGGIFGFMLGVTIWNACGYEPTYATAGGLIGLVFLGMISFILFRTSVILFMSIQGSVMLVFGLLGLAFKYESLGTPLHDTLSQQNFILPITLLVPFVFGLLYQGSVLKAEGSKDSKKKG